jgi:hypothetical protein
MKKTLLLLTLFLTIQSCKKPQACISVSNENPAVNDYITIDAFCSTKAKWFEYEIDGKLVYSDMDSDIEYSFKTKGSHTIKLTVYKKWEGSYNSRTGCSGCKGAGKSSSVTKTINVK